MSETAAPTPLAKVQDLVVKYGFVAVTILLLVFFALTEPAFRTSASM